MLFTEWKSDHFLLKYGKKDVDFFVQGPLKKAGGAFIGGGTFIGKFMVDPSTG